jgi:tripeptidyl-peptidase-1
MLVLPEFPAACPWVTAVGATVGIPEKAANLSGGGFSVFFPVRGVINLI